MSSKRTWEQVLQDGDLPVVLYRTHQANCCSANNCLRSCWLRRIIPEGSFPTDLDFFVVHEWLSAPKSKAVNPSPRPSNRGLRVGGWSLCYRRRSPHWLSG